MKVGDEVYYDNLPGVGIVTSVVGDIAHVDWDSGSSTMTSKKMLRLKNSKEDPKGHPNAAILMEIAKEAAINPEFWKEFEWEGQSGSWTECGGDKPIYFLLLENYNIRRKPRTIRIGNYDVPEPSEVSIKHFDISTTVMIEFEKGEDAKPMLKALQELLGAKQ